MEFQEWDKDKMTKSQESDTLTKSQ